jgi:hypothetical protein
VLLDAWQLSRADHYLDKAEELIRRCIHPADDVESLDLLNAEKNWSYTMFLAALDRYLSVKAEANRLDDMYAYAQASLLRYARWMLDHERPYLDAREKLEYPTETWAAQDFRKANVLKRAARHAGPDLAAALSKRGDELAELAWRDLMAFESPWTARALALVMVEGTRLACGSTIDAAPRAGDREFATPQLFLAQKQRVKRQFRSPGGLIRLAARVLRRGPRMIYSRITPRE